MNLDGPNTNSKVFITRSFDGGATFEALDPPSPEKGRPFDPSVRDEDLNPALAVDGRNSGRVYVSWNRQGLENRDNRILVAASSDGGQSFLAPKLADSVLQLGSTTSRAAVGPDGTLYVVFADIQASLASNGVLPVDAYVASSGDQGQSFSSPAPAADIGSGCNNLSCDELHNTGPSSDIFSFAAGPAAGQLQLAFWDRVDGRYRLLLRSSGDGGRSWSQSRVFGIPPGRAWHEQHRPSVSIAPGGRIDIAYYDIAPPDANGERAQDVYSIYSCDGGASFSLPRRLSAVASNTAIGPPKSGSQGTVLPFGLVGAASAETEVFASWTDTRRGTKQSRKQDVFFSSLGAPLCGGQPPGPGRPPAPVLPGPDPGTPPGGHPGGGGLGGGGPQRGPGAVAGCARGKNVIAATSGDDRRRGTNAADEIFAGTGNDVVDGLAGDDCIDLGPGRDRGQGSRGNDLVVGGLGADLVGGSSGRDRLSGGSGSDSLSGGSGNDRALGGTGRDRIDGGFGSDRLHGLAQNDRIAGSRGRDRINGGRGRDRLAGGSSRDMINGDAGNDRIDGGSSGDILRGNSGNDRIIARTGRDRISAGSGRDRISARDGRRDRITCGRGRDTVLADRSDWISRSCERVRRR